jgi:hypothetical protein
MNTFSLNNSHDAIFASLRAKLCREVSSSAVLLALLQRVNKMQAVHTEPAAYKASFDDFVVRAHDHLDVVRPFFPMLVCFLPSHPSAASEPHGPECYKAAKWSEGIRLAS